MANNYSSISPAGLSIGVLLVIIFTKLSSFLSPYQMYFTFTDFFLGDDSNNKWIGLTIKLIIPVLVGFMLFSIPFSWITRVPVSRKVAFRSYRYLARQAAVTAISACIGAALLQAWPFIQYWDILQRPDYGPFRVPFLAVYALYLISYGYFALVGIYLGKLFHGSRLPKKETEQALAGVGWLTTIKTAVLGAVTTALASLYASHLHLPSFQEALQ